MLFLRQSLTIAAKDLRAELRTKEAINASASFALVILLLFSFAFDPTADQTKEMSGGLLWLDFAFAGALILNRSFARELTDDCLDALIASPVSGAALFLGKCLANLALLLAEASRRSSASSATCTGHGSWPLVLCSRPGA
jgi:heme exporter protein B